MYNIYDNNNENVNILGWDDDELRMIGEVNIDGLTTTVPVEPDFESMEMDDLKEYIDRAEEILCELQQNEPERGTEEYKEWVEKQEIIEEMIDAAETALGGK